MPFNVQTLSSSLNKSGLAKVSHFEVQITGKGNSALEESMMARIDTVDLPGRSLMTTEHKFTNIGPLNKVPYGGVTYGDLTMSIIMSEDMREKEYFENWQNSMVDTGAFEVNGTAQDFAGRATLSKFGTKYFDDYYGTVTIRQYGSAGDLKSIHTLNEAYPIIINPISMSWADEQFAKLSVTFAYRNYRTTFFKTDQPGLGKGFSFRIGTDGSLAGSLRLPGIGDIAAVTKGDFKGVTAKINGLGAIKAVQSGIQNKVAQIRKFF
jgi:hypothetical protein